MPAAATDYFMEATRRFSSTIGSGGVADSSVQTIPMTSVTGLSTATGIELTLDRVNVNGVKTLDKEEVVRGVVNGLNIINTVRGVEGTAQAHAAGAVVEMRLTADMWNRMITGVMVEHNQNGTHKSALVTSLKASGAEVTTGTEDAKIVTPKALSDAGILVGGKLIMPHGDSVAPTDEGELAWDSDDNRAKVGDGSGTKTIIPDTDKAIPISFLIDGGAAVPTTGVKGALQIAFACEIERVDIVADASGSAVVDIWKDTYANYPPTDADSITASAPPTLSSAVKNTDTTLTDWTKAIAAGDYLIFNLDSVATCKWILVTLWVKRT